MGRRYRGMVLAAGFGSRLAPLTDVLPKPLVPIGRQRFVEAAIGRLTHLGIDEIAVNLHHLAEQIPEALGSGQRYGCRLEYFNEPELLGTGGGIKNAAAFLRGAPFVVTNADVWTTIDFSGLLEQHESSGATATLAVRPEGPSPHSVLLVDAEDRILDVGGALGVADAGLRRTHFIGLHVYEPEVLDRLPDGVSETPRDLWLPLLREKGPGVLGAFLRPGYFSDVGTWDRLLQTHRECLQIHHPDLPPEVHVHDPVHVDASARLLGPVELGPAVTLGPHVVVEGPATLSDLIVLPHSRLGPGEYRRGVHYGGRLIQPPAAAHKESSP